MSVARCHLIQTLAEGYGEAACIMHPSRILTSPVSVQHRGFALQSFAGSRMCAIDSLLLMCCTNSVPPNFVGLEILPTYGKEETHLPVVTANPSMAIPCQMVPRQVGRQFAFTVKINKRLLLWLLNCDFVPGSFSLVGLPVFACACRLIPQQPPSHSHSNSHSLPCW